MAHELPDSQFRHLWQRLQSFGLNAYEARSYLVLLGHPRFKALELAARAQVPRQKIYEVLDSLLEKGFAQVVQERTKMFSAIPPDQAIPCYLDRRNRAIEAELREQEGAAKSLMEELASAAAPGEAGRSTLDFLRIIHDPQQAANYFRRLLGEARDEYMEFSRPPYAVEALDVAQVLEAQARGVRCRLLVEQAALRSAFQEYERAGVEIRRIERIPMKVAVFDGQRGMLALLDPVVTRTSWTTLAFDHPGMAESMKILFEDYWRRAVGSSAGTMG